MLWIRQSIRRALASQGKTIRMPVYAADQIYHLGRDEMRLREQLGRDATETELAAELGLKSDRIGELRIAAIRPASLDAPLGDNDSSRLADVVADENAELPGFNLDKEGSFELLNEVLPKLPPREAAIIRLRFGLEGGVEKTLEKIGALMRLTRERIRQLQNVALIHVEQPCAITLRVKGQKFRRDFILRLELECHSCCRAPRRRDVLTPCFQRPLMALTPRFADSRSEMQSTRRESQKNLLKTA